FFFKQKTAYEMVGSDWSSDVCSSDLILEGPLLEMPCAGADNLEACDRPQTCSVHELFQRVHESLDLALGSTTLAEVAASAGGPPYPPAVRKRRVAEHAARQAVAAAALARGSAPSYAGATTTDS